MQTKFLLVAGGAVVLIGGFFVWQLLNGGLPKEKPKPTDGMVPSRTDQDPVSELRNGRGTFADLLRLNQNFECAIRHTTSLEGQVEGNVFMSQGRLRGDFMTTEDGATTLSSMIVDEKRTMFIWSEVEGELYGMKVALEDTTPDEGSIDAREPISVDTEVSYDCKSWRAVDNSIFTPPANVLFRDLKDITSTGMEFGTVYEQPADAKALQCQVCEQMEAGAAKTQCLTTFSCE